MTVIVWDGKTLAADRQHNSGNLRCVVNKLTRHGDMLIGGAGLVTTTQAMTDWIIAGMDRATFPKEFIIDEPGQSSPVWVINRNGTIAKFENSPYPMIMQDKTFAEGSGRDFAYGAMAMGADAVKAVEVASLYDIYCGGGVDALSFDD